MKKESQPTETILVVDDEDSVRKTFREWLTGANLNCSILAASDAASALKLADREQIDLAVLDWNLGAGNDGLQLLEDLRLFSPEVVAILVTGFAHQATPLAAMRMGVRDYLDKNHDLDRETFLRVVRNQLDRIRPAKRARQLNEGLRNFRSGVEKILPLVQAAAALRGPLPLPAALRSLFAFLLQMTGARDGYLLVRDFDPAAHTTETCHAYDAKGNQVADSLASFARSVAGGVASTGQPAAMENPDQAARAGLLELQPFERGRHSLLAAPIAVNPGVLVVLELLDKYEAGRPRPFTEKDRSLLASAADFGGDILRQALAERQTNRLLADAVEAALETSDSVARSLQSSKTTRPEDPPPEAVLKQLHQGLSVTGDAPLGADQTLRLAEAIRVLALRYGSPAVEHCTRLVEGLRRLLDDVAGPGEASP
jgi:DNA-binding response OmpR family regulator